MLKLLLLASILFLFVGCTAPAGDSAGSGSSSSSSSSGGAAGSGLLAGGSGSSGDGSSGGGSTIPTHHNPEPATLMLFAVGLTGLAIVRLRKKRK